MLRVNIQIIDDIFIVGNYQVKYVSKVMCWFIYCLGEIKLKQQVTLTDYQEPTTVYQYLT